MEFSQNTLNGLSSTTIVFLPSTVEVNLILAIGWFIAGFIKRLIERTKIDDKQISDKMKLSSFIGKLVYFLVMVFVCMPAL